MDERLLTHALIKKKSMQKTSESMVYLGIDIGKASHAWTLVDQHGCILEEGEVRNEPDRLASFARRILKAHPNFLVGCEATGSYYEKVAIIFSELNIIVRVINPALTSTKALRSSMRLTKTDKQDARGIAQKIQQLRGEIGSVFQWNPEERCLQALSRHIQFLKKQRTSLKVHTQDILSRPFEMVNVNMNMNMYDKEIKRLEKALIKETMRLHKQAMDTLVAIRGVGEASAAKIFAETMNLDRFKNSKAFAAFVGLDPTLKQSGTSVHGKSRLSKAGSPHLRATLTWTAKLLVRWNPTFRECFENALARGKAPGVAYGMIARKFATCVHQCVTNNEVFDLNKVGLGTKNLT